MNAPNFLLNDVEERENFCRAIATIIEDIQKAHAVDGKPMSDIALAESIDVSKGTIANAKYGRNGLGSLYLSRLGKRYGASFLDPYFALFGAQAAPIEPKPGVDVLPIVNRLALKIAEARDPSGPGGATEVPQERRAYLSDAKAVQREVGCLISEIEAAA